MRRNSLRVCWQFEPFSPLVAQELGGPPTFIQPDPVPSTGHSPGPHGTGTKMGRQNKEDKYVQMLHILNGAKSLRETIKQGQEIYSRDK